MNTSSHFPPKIVHMFTHITHAVHEYTSYKREAKASFLKGLLCNIGSTIRSKGSFSGCVPSPDVQETILYDTKD